MSTIGSHILLPIAEDMDAGMILLICMPSTVVFWMQAKCLPNVDASQVFAKCRKMFDARQLFDEMPKQNLVVWNVVIIGYAQHGQSE